MRQNIKYSKYFKMNNLFSAEVYSYLFAKFYSHTEYATDQKLVYNSYLGAV
jgi:hypothetical protein